MYSYRYCLNRPNCAEGFQESRNGTFFIDKSGLIELINAKIATKEKMTRDDEVMLGIYQLRKQRYIQQRANWTKQLIEANPTREISLFLLKDELADSLDAQKRLFRKLVVQNKESNIYKVLESKLK